jgi:hypothetical protein
VQGDEVDLRAVFTTEDASRFGARSDGDERRAVLRRAFGCDVARLFDASVADVDAGARDGFLVFRWLVLQEP